jgi:hypothetical protein
VTFKADPDNLLLGRMNRCKLEAEALRDAMLDVAGALDTSAGGVAINDLNTPRRSLYVMTIRSDRANYRSLFDAADASAIVEKRTDSTVAPQALFLMNHPFVLDRAKQLAARVANEGGADDATKIDWLYRTLFARHPEGERDRDREGANGTRECRLAGLLSRAPVRERVHVRGLTEKVTPWRTITTPTAGRCLRRSPTGSACSALASLIANDAFASPAVDAWLTDLRDPTRAAHPLAARAGMYAAKAKRVIFLFMSGGPSHVDTFDPKPMLQTHNGKPLPFPMPKLERTKTGNLLASPGSSRSTASAARRSRSCSRTSPAAWTTCASSARWWPTTSTITARVCR